MLRVLRISDAMRETGVSDAAMRGALESPSGASPACRPPTRRADAAGAGARPRAPGARRQRQDRSAVRARDDPGHARLRRHERGPGRVGRSGDPAAAGPWRGRPGQPGHEGRRRHHHGREAARDPRSRTARSACRPRRCAAAARRRSGDRRARSRCGPAVALREAASPRRGMLRPSARSCGRPGHGRLRRPRPGGARAPRGHPKRTRRPEAAASCSREAVARPVDQSLLISTRRASASAPPAPASTNTGGRISRLASSMPAAFSASRTASARFLASSSFFATSPVLSV